MNRRILRAATLDEVSRMLAQQIVRSTVRAVKVRGYATIVLSGGATPRRLFELLSNAPYRDMLPWESIHMFWGDERCVPPDDRHSNYRMAHEALLQYLPTGQAHIHRIMGELSPSEAVAAYELEIDRFFEKKGLYSGDMPPFDIILLGMGADGHTASIFPGSPALDNDARKVLAIRAPEGTVEPQRITMSLPLISTAREVIFLVGAAGKNDVLRAILDGGEASARYPAGSVRAQRTLWWYIGNSYSSGIPTDRRVYGAEHERRTR